MRSWNMAVLSVGVLAGCGAEPQSAGAGGSAGGEHATAEVIEVDESALPRSEIVEVVPVLVHTPVEGEAVTPSEGEPRSEDEIASADMPDEPPPEPTEAPMTARSESPTDLCPSEVPGLQARARETEHRAVLVLTTTHPERVDELRARVRKFADLLAEERHDAECAPCAEPTGATAFAAPHSEIHHARDVRLVDLPRGVRVEIVPYADQPRRALMTQIRDDARALDAGRCPLSFQTT